MTSLVPQGTLFDDGHVELPAPAVSPAAPDERPAGERVQQEGHEHEQCRVGQHGRPPADAQDLVDAEMQQRQDNCRRKRGQDRPGEDEPEEQAHSPRVEITTDPPDAENLDLNGGENVTLTANATDVDGDITAIEWDVDQDGEYERSGETITMQLNYCGSLEVSVRVTDNDGMTTTESVTLTTA